MPLLSFLAVNLRNRKYWVSAAAPVLSAAASAAPPSVAVPVFLAVHLIAAPSAVAALVVPSPDPVAKEFEGSVVVAAGGQAEFHFENFETKPTV